MDGAHDIADSTDWLKTPLKDFATLENALHCQICKEFYDTPMITSCAHTFCSKCIRTSLSTDGKCPACRTSDQASKLRKNWALQEIVVAFQDARPAALQVARKEQEKMEAQSGRSGKRKRVVLDSDDVMVGESDRPTTRSTRSKSRKIASSSQGEPIEIGDSEGDDDDDFEPDPEPHDGKVACPLGCGKRMHIEQVDPHLDRCEDEKKNPKKTKAKMPLKSSFDASRVPQKPRPQERISELTYNLMNERALRKKLEEQGVPAWGVKALVVKRHREWVNIWNANCDSNKPRATRELLKDLQAWERTQGGNAPLVTSTIMRKDFDAAGWASKNKCDFDQLISNARQQRADPKPPTSSSSKVDAGAVRSVEPVVSGGAKESSDGMNWESSHATEANSARLYEGNTEAIASIKAKVDAANAGQEIEPVMNAGFQATVQSAHTLLSRPRSSPQETEDERQNSGHDHRLSSGDEHIVRENTGSAYEVPAHLIGSSKQVPLFEIPQDPIMDVE